MGIEDNGIFQLDLATKKMKSIALPPMKKAKKGNKGIWTGGYRDVCIASPVTADGIGGSMLFLHYKKRIYALDASLCAGPSDTCTFKQLTVFNHHEGFKKTMACAAHAYKVNKKGDVKYSFYVTQREGSKIVALDLSNALKVRNGTVGQTVLAKATGASTDGSSPTFMKFQSIAVYAPSWNANKDPYIVLSGGDELRIFDQNAKHARTLARTKDGAVVTVGDYAFSGREVLYRTDLSFQVSCSSLNTHVLPALIRWNVPSSALYGKETETIPLVSGANTTPWAFKAIKKKANLVNGVLEKLMMCARQAVKGKTYSQEHCCVMKFSRKTPQHDWPDQEEATELY